VRLRNWKGELRGEEMDKGKGEVEMKM